MSVYSIGLSCPGNLQSWNSNYLQAFRSEDATDISVGLQKEPVRNDPKIARDLPRRKKQLITKMKIKTVQMITMLYLLMSVVRAEQSCCSDDSCKSCMNSVTKGRQASRCNRSPDYCGNVCHGQ